MHMQLIPCTLLGCQRSGNAYVWTFLKAYLNSFNDVMYRYNGQRTLATKALEDLHWRAAHSLFAPAHMVRIFYIWNFCNFVHAFYSDLFCTWKFINLHQPLHQINIFSLCFCIYFGFFYLLLVFSSLMPSNIHWNKLEAFPVMVP